MHNHIQNMFLINMSIIITANIFSAYFRILGSCILSTSSLNSAKMVKKLCKYTYLMYQLSRLSYKSLISLRPFRIHTPVLIVNILGDRDSILLAITTCKEQFQNTKLQFSFPRVEGKLLFKKFCAV